MALVAEEKEERERSLQAELVKAQANVQTLVRTFEQEIIAIQAKQKETQGHLREQLEAERAAAAALAAAAAACSRA